MEPTAVQQPPVYQPRTVSYAGFWKRFVAYIIDQIILSIVSFVVVIPLLAMIGIGMLTPGDSDLSEGLIFALLSAYFSLIVFLIIGQWLYYALMESMRGATLGKMALGIIVTDMQGNPISFGRATGRYFAKIISSLTLCIGYIMAGFTQQKQALHDIIAGCLVVNK